MSMAKCQPGGRKSTGRAKPKPPAYLHALPALVLAVDPGSTSGWAVLRQGALVACGEVAVWERADLVEEIVRKAMNHARAERFPLVVVRETWGQSARLGNAVAGLYGARKLWDEALRREVERNDFHRVCKPVVLAVHTSTWRARVLGTSRLLSGQAKARAELVAQRTFPKSGPPKGLHNAAEAVCIGLWAARAGEVGAKLPKRFLAKHGLRRPGEMV